MICIVTAVNTRTGLARTWLFAIAFAPILALHACATIDAKQNQLALRPTPGRPSGLPDDAVLFRPGDQRRLVNVPSADPSTPDRLALWWLPNPDPRAPTLLYLHGTFRNLYLNLPKIDALRDAGFAIVAVDYRGWGDSTPIVPSEQTIDSDVEVAWAELVRHQPDAGRRVIFGHSMGGAAAVTLASRLRHGRDYGALVLESTFTRLPDVAAAAGFWGRVGATLTTLKFDSLSKIGRVDAPVLMLHGSADKVVPIELGRRLRDAAPPGVHWVEVAGGTHSQLHREAPALYRQTMQTLIDQLAPAAPAPGPTPAQ
jgi:pimeloyl-ACP methyl ester carboxylesterase